MSLRMGPCFVPVLLAGAMVAAGPASAATAFSFGDGVDDLASLGFTESGLGLTVEGFNRSYDPVTGSGPVAGVNQGDNGLGVSLNPESGRIAAGKALRFTFAQDVSLTSLVIHESGREVESFDLYDSTNSLVLSQVIDGDTASPFHTILLVGLNLTGDVFTIVGTSISEFGSPNPNRGVRVQGLSAGPAQNVSAVPVPAPLLLGLSGIGLFGFFARLGRRS